MATCYRSINNKLQKGVGKCILYARPRVHIVQKNMTCGIDLSTSQWGSDAVCNFVFFTILASFVYGIIAVWFFIMCAPSTRSMQEDSIIQVWKIVPPAAFFSFLIALLTLAMAWRVSAGLNTIFRDLEEGSQTNCTKGADRKEVAPWDDDSITELYNKRLPVQIFVWLMLVSWLMATLSLLCRCMMAADFTTDGEVRLLRRVIWLFGGEDYFDL
ncbi:uncharacterized protein LOC135401442 isoform X2 [Ornithodoros turicata]|uniref:uncharacterized protein LOC135401442 isoform X2 n=1 Tax=Ornithodoros turicata TaxID=34597 RepID=UPI00313887E4